MTRITRKTLPAPLVGLFLSAALVLSGCGEDDPAPTPAPTPAPAPAPEPEPEPSGPGVPGGLTITPASATSLTVSWTAVEGATGYDIQVSLEPTFESAFPIVSLTGTTHTQTVPPGVTGYVRVRATTGEGDDKVTGDWSASVTASAPLSVTFSLSDKAKSSHFLVAIPNVDADGDALDKKLARARVNGEITVTASGPAVIVPTFVEGASGVTVGAGASNPFTNVDWEVLQSAVLDGGATFQVTGTSGGTAQLSQITCGPFECVEGADPPDITAEATGVCDAWDPKLTLEIGKVDNDRNTLANGGDVPLEDGTELGWTYSSDLNMIVEHSLGTNASGTAKAAKGKNQGLPTPFVSNGNDPVLIRSGKEVALVKNNDSDLDDDIDACGDYDTGVFDLVEPRGCFRIYHTAEDYIANYQVTAKADVAFTWGVNSFSKLSCDPVTFDPADQGLDMCALFEAEVDQAHPAGGASVTDYVVAGTGADAKLVGFELSLGASEISKGRFLELWYHDGTVAGRKVPRRLYTSSPGHVAGKVTKRGAVLGSDGDPRNVWVPLLDADKDPLYGDVGKVDAMDSGTTGGNGKADNFDADALNCSAADGGAAGTSGKSTLCDGSATIETKVVYTDLVPLGSGHRCSVERTYTINCTWDASGELNRGRADAAVTAMTEGSGSTTNAHRFISCQVS